jgi:hypothetical protein
VLPGDRWIVGRSLSALPLSRDPVWYFIMMLRRALSRLLMMSVLACWAFAAEVDLTKPIAAIRLPDGRILKNVTFTKYGPETISTKSSLGFLAIRYEALPDDIRAAAEQKRPGGAKWFPGDTSGNTEKIEGQIFVTTLGAGSYKFSSVEVYAFDLAALDFFKHAQGTVNLPRPISVATSDADGKFILKVPITRPYFIFAQALRLRTVGPDTYPEVHEWRVPMNEIRQGRPLFLSEQNSLRLQTKVKIEPYN